MFSVVFKTFAVIAAVAGSAMGATLTATAAKRQETSGEATYYYPDVGASACGPTWPDSDYVIALSADLFDQSQCFRGIQVTGPNGASTTGFVGDECPGCDASHLDLSPSLFEVFAPLSEGVIEIEWYFT